jgi:hypothetical protein
MKIRTWMLSLALLALSGLAQAQTQAARDMLTEVDVAIAKAEKLTPVDQRKVRDLRAEAVQAMAKKGGEGEARELLWIALKIMGKR